MERASNERQSRAYLRYDPPSQGSTGQHWMLNVGVCYVGVGSSAGVNGWIDGGRLARLPLANGRIAGEAW